MSEYEELFAKYEALKQELEKYQDTSEKMLQSINEKNSILEKQLDALSNIVEVSKYINSYISDNNLISMINDMIIGILGVKYSTIYIKEEAGLFVKATNVNKDTFNFYKSEYEECFKNGSCLILNNEKPLFPNEDQEFDIHSIIGVPIKLGEKLIGYIIVEHTLYNFFNRDNIKFVTAIANQIAIALENNFLYRKIKETSVRDPLLGIYNRRYFFDTVEKIIKENPQKGFAIVMLDIDNFKKANDVYGHQYGDEVLIQIGKLIESRINPNDIVARYGGEEIVIYIEEVQNREQVFKRVDSVRKAISEKVITYGNIKGGVTASFGIGYYPANGEGLSDVISIADTMMYTAKQEGKNRVISA